ncbi:hypothetical protein LZ31DRAFT_281240 [Colletotrichum somersetense]|nr:hypothetical protein LZ31DRAFT_281240 [Colletotrichum somersetense]
MRIWWHATLYVSMLSPALQRPIALLHSPRPWPEKGKLLYTLLRPCISRQHGGSQWHWTNAQHHHPCAMTEPRRLGDLSQPQRMTPLQSSSHPLPWCLTHLSHQTPSCFVSISLSNPDTLFLLSVGSGVMKGRRQTGWSGLGTLY